MTQPSQPRATVPPEIVSGASGRALLDRTLSHPSLDGYAVDERSMLYQAIAPPTLEISELYLQLAYVIYLRSLVGPSGFVAHSVYLDEIGYDELGVPRLGESPARIVLRFAGTGPGIIPEGTLLQTASSPPIQFRTTTATTLVADPAAPGGFSGGALADCLQIGIVGNVPANTVTRFVAAAPTDVSNVTNPTGVPLVAGADTEADDPYRTRLLRFRRDPPNGANAAQFRMWAEQVPGVGRAECIRPLEPIGPGGELPPPAGTCWVYVTGTALITPYPGTGLMAPPAVVDAVQMYIAPQRPAVDIQPGDVPPVDMPDDDVGTSLAWPLPTAQMEVAGIWSLRLALSITNPPADPTTPVVTAQVFNVTDNVVLDGRPNGQAPQAAIHTFTAGELESTPPTHPSAAPVLDFFWDGSQVPADKLIEIRVSRSATEAAAGNGIVHFSGAWVLSSFADPTHEGLAPVNMRVEVYASRPVPIDVAVSIQNKPGWTMAATQTWVEGAISDYLRGLVYAGSAAPVAGLPDRRANDVLYGMLAAVLLGGCQQGDTPLRYYDPTTLRLNGGTVDVEVWTGDIAVLGSVTLTQIVP